MSKYRIEIDPHTCVADRNCGELAPNTFAIDDQGRACVLDPNGDPPEDILAAAKDCRLHAMTLYDADTGAKVWPPY